MAHDAAVAVLHLEFEGCLPYLPGWNLNAHFRHVTPLSVRAKSSTTSEPTRREVTDAVAAEGWTLKTKLYRSRLPSNRNLVRTDEDGWLA